jgi:hypothetical protein
VVISRGSNAPFTIEEINYMAEYGVATWDGNGKANNYGIKPVSVSGHISLSSGQKSGSYSVSVPPGCKLTYFQISNDANYSTARRKINISGGSVTITGVSDTDYSANTEPAIAAFLIFQIEAA